MERRSIEPATRFVLAQSWWIMAELVRRHPEYFVHEMHPGGGMYDCLALFHPDRTPDIELNRVGRVHVHSRDDFHMTWSDVMAAASPHDVVRAIEKAAALRPPVVTPSSSPKVVAYRLMATVLRSGVDDRAHWDARNDFIDSSGEEADTHGYLRLFPHAQRDAVKSPRRGLHHEPDSHYWAVLRDHEPVALISIDGRLYRDDRMIDLMPSYLRGHRRIAPVVMETLGDLLP